MDKLTAIKIKYDDGTYSDEIPVSVLSKNVEWDSTHTLVDVLGSIDVDFTGTIQDQISRLFNEKVSATQLQNYVVSQLNEDVSSWLNTNVNPVGSAVVVDSSLTISGAAADAKIVGDNIGDLKSAINYIIVGQKSVSASEIIQGTYNLGGAVVSNANRIRTNGFIDVKKGEKIVFTPSTNVHEIFVGYFSTSGSWIRDGSWLPDLSMEFDNDYKIILVFRRKDTTQAITPSDYDASTIFYLKQDAINKSIENINETYVVPFKSESSGYLKADGTIYGTPNFSCTDYIAIHGKVMINGNLWYVPSGHYYVACYDSNKSFLGVLLEGNGKQKTINEFLTLPTGTAFIKVCNWTPQVDSFDVIVFNNISDIAQESAEAHDEIENYSSAVDKANNYMVIKTQGATEWIIESDNVGSVYVKAYPSVVVRGGWTVGSAYTI